TISEEDGRRLEQLGARPAAIEVTGDTRYDSVAERAERFDRTRDPFARLAIAPANTFTIVAGSTWPADEAVILPAFVDLLAQVPPGDMGRDATRLIERGGAVALSADGRHQLHSQWLVWHHDPGARTKAGAAGKRLVREGRGAAERTTALVKKLVGGGWRRPGARGDDSPATPQP